MTVDNQRIVLELQVEDEKDYPERSLYYWAREYSSALKSGMNYRDLPRTIIISILSFSQFDCEEFHSEFRPLEVTRHTLLSDRQELHYFELPKVPRALRADDMLGLWLNLFGARTEDEIKQIEGMGVHVMSEAVKAYRHVSATDEFKELERLRERARHNEASALRNAEERGRRQMEEQMQSIVAEKDAEIAGKDAEIAGKDAEIAGKDAEIAGKDAEIAGKDAEIAALRAILDNNNRS